MTQNIITNRVMGSVLKPWPETKKLRRWQRRGLQQWIFDNKRDFLLVATPGAGKTRYALWGAHYLISAGRVARLVVVCPTENIK